MVGLRVSAPCSTSPMHTVTSQSMSVHSWELRAALLQDGAPLMGTPSCSPVPTASWTRPGSGAEPTPAGWRHPQQVRWDLNAKEDLSRDVWAPSGGVYASALTAEPELVLL